jgi:hypothetical protein
MIKKSIDMALTIRYIIIVSLFCLSIVMTIAVFVANVYADSYVSSNTTKKNSTNLISIGQPVPKVINSKTTGNYNNTNINRTVTSVGAPSPPPSNMLNSNPQPIVNAGSGGVGGNGSSNNNSNSNKTNQVIGPVIAKNYGISSSSSNTSGIIGPSKPITKEDAMKAYDKANVMVKAYEKANQQSGPGARTTTTTTAANATQQQQQQQQQLIIQNNGSSSSTALPPPTSSEPTEIPVLPGIIP